MTITKRNIFRTISCFMAITALGPQAGWGSGKLVVGYYPSWNRSTYPHTVIAYANLTHIAHAFVAATVAGGLEVPAGFLYPELNQAAHAQGVKVVVSVGGWGEYSDRFSPMAADTAARHRFVATLKSFCVTNSYDGADLDWEYPKNAGDRANMQLLVAELRSAFNTVQPALLLSMAGPSTGWSGQWFDLAVMKNDFDWIGIMTYDYYGTWTSKSGPNSALYGNWVTNTEGWIDYAVDYYNGNRGVPKEKLLIGIPFYGWMFNAATMYGASTGASQLTYSSIAPRLAQGWVRTWDAVAQQPYMINPQNTQVISYDDSASVAAKCTYVSGKGVGGAIIWAVGQDVMGGQAPLLNVAGAMLRSTGVSSPESPALTPTSMSLSQNYPNPFNPVTTIQYTVGGISLQASGVRVSVYDLLGREVAVLVNAQQEPGTHTVEFDARNLASGVYVCRLVAGSQARTRMMTLLR